ncbi:Clavaminate synthase-like protein [Paramyrothecium foliicola]|nr:Clavaminate synthase-like protein [Paramyrothecium foliicola]
MHLSTMQRSGCVLISPVKASTSVVKRAPFRLRNMVASRSFATTNVRKAILPQDTDLAGKLSEETASRINIPIDGTPVGFSAVLLRDSCSCPSCVHESSNQRLFSAADIPANIRAQSVETDTASDSVTIRWTTDVPGFDADHSTTLKLGDLREVHGAGTQIGVSKYNTPSQALWSLQSFDSPDHDYATYMNQDRTVYEVVKQLRIHGLAFINNVPGLEKSLATIATRIGPIKDTFYGYTWDVRTVPQAINAAYTSQDLGFHTDLLYFEQPPHVQLLHCIQSAATGGASVFVDAYRAAVDLLDIDPEAFDILSTIPVNYHYNHPDSNVYRTTKPVIDLRTLRLGDNVYTHLREYIKAWEESSSSNAVGTWGEKNLVDCIEKINWGPPFLAPFSNHEDSPHMGDPAAPALAMLNTKVDKWHRAATKFNTLLQRPEYQFERKMNPGDCVLFDNTRILHSRRAFDMADMGKPRWLRGTYVDKDPYYSRLRVLQNKFRAE